MPLPLLNVLSCGLMYCHGEVLFGLILCYPDACMRANYPTVHLQELFSDDCSKRCQSIFLRGEGSFSSPRFFYSSIPGSSGHPELEREADLGGPAPV